MLRRHRAAGTLAPLAGQCGNVGVDVLGDGPSRDAIAGVRYLHARQSLDWNFTGNVGPIPAPGRAGGASTSIGNLDAIVGLRARVSAGFHSPWFFPLYVDAGFGQSDLTWQAMAGVGYAASWGEIVAAWRHMEYRMASDTAPMASWLAASGIRSPAGSGGAD
jgi:hypothetical protein